MKWHVRAFGAASVVLGFALIAKADGNTTFLVTAVVLIAIGLGLFIYGDGS